MPRFCILGLDAMDLRVARRLDLKNLLLDYNGELEIPLYDKYRAGEKIAFSPVIWASFLTGKEPKEHGNYTFYKYDNPLVQWASKKFRGHWLLRGKGELARKLGLRKKASKARGKTIFDVHGNKAVQFLGLNWSPKKWSELCLAYEKEDWSQEKLYKKFVDLFEEVTFQGKEPLDALNEWWSGGESVIGYYTPFLDYCQHLFPDSSLVDEAYREADKFAGLLRKVCPELLIVSDHGFDGPNHSKVGYWSSTRDFKVSKITDFYDYFVSDKEEVLNRLKKLGYI